MFCRSTCKCCLMYVLHIGFGARIVYMLCLLPNSICHFLKILIIYLLTTPYAMFLKQRRNSVFVLAQSDKLLFSLHVAGSKLSWHINLNC